MGQKVATLILLALLAGCTTTQPAPIADPRAVWCEHNEPRRPSPEEITAMSIDEKRKAVEHNRQGALWCGWEA